MFEWVQYQFPSRVFFERDSTHKVGSMVKDIASRVLLLSIKKENTNPDELAIIKTSIEKHTSGCILYDDLNARPGYQELDTAAHFAKQCKADLILAFGSRDSIHAAKAIALLSRNQIFAADLNQTSFPLRYPPLPVVTVPAVPCMGEECSPTFEIHDKATKTSFFGYDHRLFPSIVFCDANITNPLQPNDLARCGVAILAAAVESILSKKANEITTSLSLRSIELITKNLVALTSDTGNLPARQNICAASLMAGMAHSNTLLGLCYSIANATANITQLDFFMAAGILLPHVMEYNLTTSAGKYVQVARALDQEIHDITVIEAAIKAVEGVRKIYSELKIPQRLSDFDIKKMDLSEIATQTFQLSSLKTTQRELDRNEIETILIAAY